MTKYALVIAEFGGWAKFQRLLRVLRGVADRHGGGTGAGTPTTPTTTTPTTPTPTTPTPTGETISVSVVATAWVLSRPAVGAAIIGARNSRHLDSTAVAARLELREQVSERSEPQT